MGKEEAMVELRSPTKMLPKIKYFIWRMAWDILSTVNNLKLRGLQVERIYYVCGVKYE